MKRERSLFIVLGLATGLVGCEPTSNTAEAAAPSWAAVRQAWTKETTGQLTATVRWGTSPRKFYSYQIAWAQQPDTYDLQVDASSLGKASVSIAADAIMEDGISTMLETDPPEGPPSLGNALALMSDTLSPFGILSGEPITKSIRGAVIEYTWTLGAGPQERTYICELDTKSRRPKALHIESPDWASTVEISYDYRPFVATATPKATRTAPPASWAAVINSSKAIALSKMAAGLYFVQPSVSEPIDALTGGRDFWKIGFDVKPVGRWTDLKGEIGELQLPAGWPKPNLIEERSYVERGTGKPIYEARAIYDGPKGKWRVTFQDSAMVEQALEMAKQVGKMVSIKTGLSVCFYLGMSGTSNPAAASWPFSRRVFVTVESQKNSPDVLDLAHDLVSANASHK